GQLLLSEEDHHGQRHAHHVGLHHAVQVSKREQKDKDSRDLRTCPTCVHVAGSRLLFLRKLTENPSQILAYCPETAVVDG
ncbi:unnamed protein product, partial [Ectocarpus sp. 12 AP-2014]